MATNQITIVLEDCEPIGGYYVFYRPVGNLDPHRFAGIFFSSPIIFTDENDPENQQYEGYIQSHCGGGIFGDQIPWETEGSESIPGPEPECCDPVILTADTETTIPDGSLPGSGSESETPVCCTPIILNACIETLAESGSESGSESPGDTFGILHLFSAEAYAILSLEDLAYWNTFYDTAGTADTPFDEIILYPEDLKILLKGATNLQMGAVWANDLDIKGFWDNSGSVISADFSFAEADNLEVVEMLYTTTLGQENFLDCASLVSALLPSVTSMGSANFNSCTLLTTVNLDSLQTMGDSNFSNSPSITTINLPSLISCGFLNFQNCNLTTIGMPVCSNLGATTGDEFNFAGIIGQTITFTLLTATATDGDVVTLQANNSVTLILV